MTSLQRIIGPRLILLIALLFSIKPLGLSVEYTMLIVLLIWLILEVGLLKFKLVRAKNVEKTAVEQRAEAEIERSKAMKEEISAAKARGDFDRFNKE